MAVVEVVAETGEAEPRGHAHPDTLQTLQIQSVTAITSMGTKLSTVSSLCHARGPQESSNRLNEPVTSLGKIIIMCTL